MSSQSKSVIVTEVASSVSERAEFELVKDENSDKQTAYITFEKESGAKTALMLSNAVLGDSQIIVKSADDTSDDSYSDEDSTSSRSKADLLAEILAAGYQLQDTIFETGCELNAKFGVTASLSQYLSTLQSKLLELDEKYKLSEKVTSKALELDTHFAIQDTVKSYAAQAQGRAVQALETSPGRIAHDLYTNTYSLIGDIQSQARRIAEEKKLRSGYSINENVNGGIQAH
ncbi:5747_t:CDS:2 [Diversispora eburnea]|uniref:5747_t:CDS:1 n=1 Tax=Diversispora eburnea TaxID=1213867 RepID=A0A9N8YKV2_9GLOM|nr:5747_t:CDS:2 [Diversispora eburnea]